MNTLEGFLFQYKVKKGDGKRFTHTRIGGKKNGKPIYPGSYSIPKNKMDEFYKLYHEKVFINGEMNI